MSVSGGRSTTPRECTPCSEDNTSPATSVMSPRENDEVSQADKQLLLKSFGEDILLPEEDSEECKCASPTNDVGICECCSCPLTKCRCKMIGREAFDEWRHNRPLGQMPAVLESTHPLMQRFQDTLKKFLERENLIVEEEILNVREELRLSKLAYDKDLETIYTSDHDTNAQRVLIEEYETTLAQKVKERVDEEQRAREANEKFKKTKEILEKNIIAERETTEELEALTNLCRQLEKWQEETESDLTISKAMSDKMKKEKKAMAEEKRELDVLIFGLSNEVWKLESKLELLQKQLEIKGEEMEKITDKVTAYATELEDLELDKRRLVSLWNSVLVNIKQRDNVYDSVREDYKELRENYHTLVTNLNITKKVTEEEMNRGKELAMNKDKLIYDITSTTKTFEQEDAKRIQLETQIAELTESLEMAERDENMLKMENKTMMNILNTTEKEFDHKTEYKTKIENEILQNLQECLLNDKAVEAMANGIKKMREMSRKQEISLVAMENQHAKVMLDIEIYRNRQAKNNQILEENSAKVKAKEKEIEDLEEKYNQKALLYTRKQRELDIITKKYTALKEIFDMKSPQERRIDELESQIKALRERTEILQHEWLRLQGHVVKLTAQHHKIVTDINLINKQIQICEQKTMRLQAECDSVKMERTKLDRLLRSLRGDLEVLERNRKDATEKNDCLEKTNAAVTHEYAANLRDAEEEILEIDDAIEALDREKINLTQELDRVQKEALIWQRKGALAVDLKKNMQAAKSAVGEIGQMKTEIHRMEVRREQLRRTSEKLADDLALCITRRETAMDKTRAAAAVEKAHGPSGHTSQSVYHHKLRLAKADVSRVTKELADAKAHMESLQKEQDRLDDKIKETIRNNQQLEEHIAQLLRETVELDKQKQWLLERVVRNQRIGNDMMKVVKKQSIKVRKPKNVVFAEFEQARALNDRITYIAETLNKEFPYLQDKMEVIMNTLNIYSPSESPRLTEEGGQCNVVLEEQDEEESEYVAEKPLCP